jgi:methylmalonyl-CoA epimerase
MKIDGLDHVAVAVRDLDAASRLYVGALGFELAGRESVDEMKVEVAILTAGDFRLELLQPSGTDSSVARFLESRGEGIHHIALRVRGLAKILKELEDGGVTLIDKVPRRGAGGSLVAFLHPRACHGTLIELCERIGG